MQNLKQLVHTCFWKLGFDIRAIKNLEAAYADMRRRNEADATRRLTERKRELQATRAQGTTSGQAERRVEYVKAEDLIAAGYARLSAVDTLLDIGCGIHPQTQIERRVHICCEPFTDYMLRLMEEHKADPAFVFVQADLKAAVEIFPPESVDCIAMVDVIEHLDKQLVLGCLARMQRIARRQIALFTPLGYMPQDSKEGDKDPWGMNGATWQMHKSGWTPDDFPFDSGWQFIVCHDFHRQDAYGSVFAKPIGAFWAIWNAAS